MNDEIAYVQAREEARYFDSYTLRIAMLHFAILAGYVMAFSPNFAKTLFLAYATTVVVSMESYMTVRLLLRMRGLYNDQVDQAKEIGERIKIETKITDNGTKVSDWIMRLVVFSSLISIGVTWYFYFN